MLSRGYVSFWALGQKIFFVGAKQVFRFLLSLYKRRDCFIDSSFLAGKEAKEAGGTYEWFPLDPLSTFDGAKQRWKSTEENTRGRRRDSMQKPGPDGAAGTARPLSVAPAQGEG